MQTFCYACGFKNIYDGTKPKTCSSCGDSMEAKPIKRDKPRRAREEDPGYDPIEKDEQDMGSDFNLDPRSIRIEADSKFMTIEELQKDGGAFAERGGFDPGPDGRMGDIRDQTIKTMMGNAPAAPDLPPPPETKSRSGARRIGKLKK